MGDQSKKFQVFISSTYKDLLNERQAAVEAVLSTSHIPAGMELFAAGDESQMEVIKRWIDESDVFLLILGGRYGSIEPRTKKSYIHLEYEYAISQNKPFFALVIHDDALENKVKSQGLVMKEQENQEKLIEFRNNVLTRMVKFFKNETEIKLFIHETLSDFEKRKEIVGWIRADQGVNTASLTNELGRLSKENAILRERLAALTSENNERKYINGLSHEEVIKLMSQDQSLPVGIRPREIDKIKSFMETLDGEGVNTIAYFMAYSDNLFNNNHIHNPRDNHLDLLLKLKFVEKNNKGYYSITDDGRKFYFRYKEDNNI